MVGGVAASVASRPMVGRLRYLLALAFVAIYFLIPDADHEHLAFLRTRAWLMGDGSPLARVVGDESTMPALAVDAAPAGRAGDYARIGREWARAKGRDIGAQPPLLLVVRVGDNGLRSTLLSGRQEIDRLELTRTRTVNGATYYPDRQSLLPAFLAIVAAIVTGKVVLSLLAGCLAGAFLFAGIGGGIPHFVADTVWLDTFCSSAGFNSVIMGFVVFLFMAVGVMTAAGGIQGMVALLRRFARGPLSAQLCSYAAGLLIFFDDYSSCILCGTTMRPLTDHNRVSREKLSYIVDSTAAPIAGISIFSTWVAYEISMFKDQLPEVTRKVADASGALVDVPYASNEGFSVFLQTLPFRFYCIFTLVMVALTIVLRREFGPMLRAERRAFHEHKPIADGAQPMLSRGFHTLEAAPDIPCRARNALVPVAVLVVLTLALIVWLGYRNSKPAELAGPFGNDLRAILNNSESQWALLWASLAAFVVAVAMVLGQRLLTAAQIASSALRAAHSLLFAIVILILAWSIGFVCEDLGTAHFLTAAFHGGFAPWVLPAILFVLASLVSFSTGTSFGTMAILLPNVVVLAHTMGETDPSLGGPVLMVLTIGAVLEGSIFGDHCSPISDTTVLSSVATASDHLHHVQTQAPYALLVMVTALVCGYLPVALLGPSLWPAAWGVGFAVIAAWLWLVGRNPERA
jgi:Na+/H+ antiporter NhaC